ncbi:MAG TPA: membrane protein insertion efficiency factor YidD [Gammaproteobacteria bacterium]|nr:membrane protein insertion efficiency factor YidD [Gammaproteobacteria bacterium]
MPATPWPATGSSGSSGSVSGTARRDWIPSTWSSSGAPASPRAATGSWSSRCNTTGRRSRTMRRLMLLMISGYRVLLSPLLGNNCRYYPTCSCYAHTAIERFGVLKGGWLALRRIGRCHPWHEGGVDPVPEKHIPHG